MSKKTKKEKPGYYGIMPANIRYCDGLTPNAKILYSEITALCNKYGYCFASNKHFSKLYNKSKVTVTSWLKSLEDHGFIVLVIKTNNRRRIYLSEDIRKLGGVRKLKGGYKKIYRGGKENQGGYNNNKPNSKKKNNKVADKSDNNMRTSLPLKNIKKSFEYKCSKRLAKKVIQKRKVCQKINLKNWANSIRKFLSHGIIKKKEFKEVLKWYIEHFGEKYMIEAFSMGKFCKRFIDIQTAMEKHRTKDITPDQDGYVLPKIISKRKKRKSK